MPTRERPADRGERIGRSDLVRVTADLRAARVAAGLSLDDVGRAVGLSRPQLSRIERAQAPATTIIQLARIGAVVGFDVRVRAYPGPDPLRDTGQIRLLDRLRRRLHPGLALRTEVALPIAGDLRAWDGWIDGLVSGAGRTVGLPVEAETRLADFQAQTRRLILKMRDGGAEHALLVVADTRSNRAAVAGARAAASDLFPVSARSAFAALADGTHPGGSALVFA